MRSGRQRNRYLKSRSSFRTENEYSPETIPQYIQITVNILEARKLIWSNSQSKNSFVVVMVGKKKHRTSLRRNMEDPCYKEFVVFDLNISIRDIRRSTIWFAVMEPRCYSPPKLLGETNIDLGAVWAEPHHQIYHKWAQLTLSREPMVGPTGYLKVDVSIALRGEIQVMPAIFSEDKVDENLLLPAGSEQQRANYVVTIFGAFGLPSGTGRERSSSKLPTTYVQVSFCGLVGKTGIRHRTNNPLYCEQISLVELFPNTDPVVRLEVCSADGVFPRTIAATELKLDKISHDGDNGFLPTFGPSLLHMYGGVNGHILGYPDDGPYHRGCLLVSFKTIVPYYQQGFRCMCLESISPSQMDSLWYCEDFSIFCPIFEVSMLDCDLAKKSYGVAITMGEIPNDRRSQEEMTVASGNIKSRKLHYTGPCETRISSNQVGCHIDLRPEFTVLQLFTNLPDFRFRMYRHNMIYGIITDLEQCTSAVEKRQKIDQYDSPNELIDELNRAIDNALGSAVKYLDVTQYFNYAPEDALHQYNTELDNKQLALQKEEIKKLYQQMSCSSCSVTKQDPRSSSDLSDTKRVKNLLSEAKTLTQSLKKILFKDLDGWPDIIVWLLNGGSRIAYAKISPANIIYSVIPEQCGHQCGAIQTLFLKPIKCNKHINTTPACYCISGKVELLFWMGLNRQKSAFRKALPGGYILRQDHSKMKIKCSNVMLECRVFIFRAKFCVESPVDRMGAFVRVNALNGVIETQAESMTPNPIWKKILKLRRSVSTSLQRLSKSPPVVLIEVFEIDESGDHLQLLGRFQIQPKVEDATVVDKVPKLQWYEIYRGLECTGQILMYVQMIQIPELLVKTTSYGIEAAASDNETTHLDEVELDQCEALPDGLIPSFTTYKVDIYWWGLRDVSISRKPCVVLEIDDLTLKSDVIVDNKCNCNFSNGRTSQVFESLLNDAYLPTMNVKLYDSSTFGRTLFLGTNVVERPSKFFVNWLSQNERKVSLTTASISSNSFLPIGESQLIKTHSTFGTEEKSKTRTNSVYHAQIKKSKFKRWYSSKEPLEEEATLLPMYTKEKNQIKVVNKVSKTDITSDWWTRFSTAENKDDNEDSSRKDELITIYNSELEHQPQFSKFKDWCSTLKLYNGKKTGFMDKDEQLHCGCLKAGIAIYKWPPPENTRAVNPFGVDLDLGYFAEHPSNDPTKHLIRVYIIRGVELKPKDFSGKCDPYVVIDCGKKRLGDCGSHVAKSVNPIFGRMYEFRATLPDDYLLNISLYDFDLFANDELIGTTTVDLENRIYSKHRATVGIGTEYSRLWRDYMKPSEILEELCCKNHIEEPTFPDNNSVNINGVEYRDNSTESLQNYETNKKESLCLSIIKKWNTLPICGYQLVPEHVETRTLYNSNTPGVEQGKLQLWIDIFPIDSNTYIPAPVDINANKVEEYELRVTIWDAHTKVDTEQAKDLKNFDLLVKVWVGLAENAQYTDVHFNSTNGEGTFNWRMIFHFSYHHAERKLVNENREPFVECEEYVPPILNIQLLENKTGDLLGSLAVDISSLPCGSKETHCCDMESLEKGRKLNLFAVKSVRAWWPLAGPCSPSYGKLSSDGVIDLELTLLPKEKALVMPVGLGRDAPSPLPMPRLRRNSSMGKCFNITMICICAVVMFVVIYGTVVTCILPWNRYTYPKAPLRGRDNPHIISVGLFPFE